MNEAEKLKNEILEKTKEYYSLVHDKSDQDFIPGESRINYGGRFFDENELVNLVDSSLEFWLTSGRFCKQFELEFAAKMGVKHCLLVNSGSSANLVAFMTLTSHKLKERAIKRGDEVITVAAGFPTTVSPLLQFGAVPVFVDVELGTYNIDCSQLELAVSDKTKAVMIAHTLGNPFDLARVKAFCDKHNLWLIEDNCDALGSEYAGQQTGTFGDIATSSFYPPHHLTMGEGGAVYMKSGKLKMIAESFRDWGRDCFCPSGKDDSCGKRFGWSLGTLPKGYDHKYIYSHFGYNLKVTDMQAAIGVEQLKKLDQVTEARRRNFQGLHDGLKDLDEFLILPQATENSDPSWFGFPITVKDSSPLSRAQIVGELEKNNIQTRMLFAGNITRHPCFDDIRGDDSVYRVVGDLQNTDKIMNDTFWLGVYPGMTQEMIEFMISTTSRVYK
ncbi:putative LPS biosynthesis related DNTP-hexose dehydratase-epimerase [Lentisphaera araneosa HTCC2155]|uniref:Putative LPS biosynthesis related DNTP-hexose dehydratase-epimerase n=1 Tax=Lentisphaera araneosa HTCC2155 TaxID=313628 RepID=A6DT21_9BACT|nr:lipopolysaccharide biosynthesis protein RfbH [Lentisphaera araneosa]EDM25196.1 putative LPS biosynthesis related DNTP-hexose dehydratase-epimerase [Lentisphaera araneosa HTCC2155]